MQDKRQKGLYDASFEHDNCGIGAVVNIKGLATHKTVDDALTIVERLEHRAGMDASRETGDGVGILTQIPHEFYRKIVTEFEFPKQKFGVGMFFFPQDILKCKKAKKMFEHIAEKEGLKVLGYRDVPTKSTVLGKRALDCMPNIVQCFIEKPENVSEGLDFDRKLFVVRKVFEKSNSDTYVCSLSSRTIVYKGMFLVAQLRKFYLDLHHQDYVSAIALVHSRFSTNTVPSWERAHPNRFIVHNGEINTIRGNANKMRSREENIKSTIFADDMEKVLPVIDSSGSDSAMLDNSLEFLLMAGISLPHAIMMSIPEPWSSDQSMSQEKKAFYQYHACLMEPWDGPASILFSDGDVMGATLDRNGLRPSRYYITKDGYVVLSSEVGVLDVPPEDIILKDRLKPGKMLLIDTKLGKVVADEEIKSIYAARQPYGEWLANNLISLKDIVIPNKKTIGYKGRELTQLQQFYDYAYEDVREYILPMALHGNEPVIAMGMDAPLAVLSKSRKSLFHYFKQLFAQVTNPPMDAIREAIVTSTSIYLGRDGNLLKETAENCELLKIDNPILSDVDLLKMKHMEHKRLKTAELSLLYYKNTTLENAIECLFMEADKAYNRHASIFILSDRGIDENHLAIPSLLAVSALNQYLVKTKKRMSVALVLESGEPFEVHHFATLLGYGASAINPYLAHDTIKSLINEDILDKDDYVAMDDYDDAILHGIVKIASKMGISTLQSYQGSQIFEAVGISQKVIDQYFTNTVSRIEGIELHDIERQQQERHREVFDELGLDASNVLDSKGAHKYRSNKEEHLYNPKTIHLLQKATREGSYTLFKQYSEAMDEQMQKNTLRGMLDFTIGKSMSIDEVESVDEIVKRFKTGAMSYGSISKEAHETLAIAMNQLQGKSNSGEGGEDPERFTLDPDGTSRCSAIKQVASGRFGVTNEYLVSAKEIQIKMAQGAKPGEGGQLPAEKVYPEIAKTRYSTPGVQLISPPPHHDIYSIEDLAQLIYDLKNVNEEARISVKLVSEAGVGTIAAGVAKAGAEVILISGYDGGTGAAPKNSVYNAGLPWELGLAETQQTLMLNGLRNRVVVESDGKLMSGRDVAIACLLGAEEFGFATAPLVTMGCIMMRVCHLDTCPVGVATQNKELRKRFSGRPEYVVNFMRYIAEELREYMALLGFQSVDEMVGQSQCLRLRDGVETLSEHQISFKNILFQEENQIGVKHFIADQTYDFELNKTKNYELVKAFQSSLENKTPKEVMVQVNNTDRTFATMLGSNITKQYGNDIDVDTYVLRCRGSGGQSFGAFIPKGLRLELEGESNDYFGKGLSGGTIIVYPDRASTFIANENIIIGNVALYGATSGEVYISGISGERFCVRNSGASAVCEGVGDHALEYMTGGKVLIIGSCGRNIAAGMSGGVAYILDENNDLYTKINREMVVLSSIVDEKDKQEIKALLEKHYAVTASKKAQLLLDDFEQHLTSFKKIIPHEYEEMMNLIEYFKQKGCSTEEARNEAFKTKMGGDQRG